MSAGSSTAEPMARPGSAPAYDQDEFAWLLHQADLLRAGRLGEVDRQPLAEFLTDMAGSHQDAFESAMRVLLQHLLKLSVPPDKLTRSWRLTIAVQQENALLLIKRRPGMRQYLPGLYADAYPVARRLASVETGIAVSRFPAANPWTMEEALAYVPPEPAPHGRRRTRGG